MKGRIGWVKENHAQKTNRLPFPNPLSFITTNTQLNTFHTESWEPIWASCNYLRYNTCCWTSCMQPWRSSVLFLRTFDMMALTACSLLGLLYTLETLKKGYKDADSSTCQRHPVIEIMLMPCWQAQKVPQNLERYAMNCSSDSGQYSSSPWSPRYLVREYKEQTKYRM